MPAKKGSKLTPFQKKRLALIDEIVQQGYSPLQVQVVQDGSNIAFTPADVAMYYALQGKTFGVIAS